ncbi:MAG: hypothetical protein LBM25_04425 [Bacteroidales bacterium]|jgi:tyrosine-protein phosphatase YwqE|nr:hypothetical protein [Bacteroidales bacterium]
MFNIFKKKDKLLKEDISLSALKTDIHSHLIPNVDDGSKSMEESISLIRQLKSFGYEKVITTPHVFYNSFPDGIEVLDEKLKELQREVERNNINIEIALGCELLLDEDVSDRMEKKQIRTFSDNYLLVEFPMNTLPMAYENWLFDLQLRGYKLVLAHPERFLYFFEDKRKYALLKDREIIFQSNIASISGYYGEDVRKAVEYLIKENMVELLGTDCHGQRHIEAIKRTLRNPLLEQLILSGKLINNKL